MLKLTAISPGAEVSGFEHEQVQKEDELPARQNEMLLRDEVGLLGCQICGK